MDKEANQKCASEQEGPITRKRVTSHKKYFAVPIFSMKSHLLTYLVGSVHRGPCLKELPHHNEVAFGGCNHQCSVSILRDSGVGMPY